jgi:hypothetical protein
MKLLGGNVNVESATGFRAGDPLPLVLLQVTGQEKGGDTEQTVEVWMAPAYARKIGLDLIGGAHQAVADVELRLIAQRNGVDGDALVREFRVLTNQELPDVEEEI